jgi:excisionase family DNA binding protein
MIIPDFQEGGRVVNPMKSNHEVLTVKEVGELLKIHESTVYKMIREGRIPAFSIGSDWRFVKDQIVHWLAFVAQ